MERTTAEGAAATTAEVTVSLWSTNTGHRSRVIDGINLRTWTLRSTMLLPLQRVRGVPGRVSSYRLCRDLATEQPDHIGIVCDVPDDDSDDDGEDRRIGHNDANRVRTLIEELRGKQLMPPIYNTYSCAAKVGSVLDGYTSENFAFIFPMPNSSILLEQLLMHADEARLVQCAQAVSEAIWEAATYANYCITSANPRSWLCQEKQGGGMKAYLLEPRSLISANDRADVAYDYSCSSIVKEWDSFYANASQQPQGLKPFGEAFLVSYEEKMDEFDEKHQEPSSEATHRASAPRLSKSDVFIQKLLETKACLEANGFTLLDDARPPLDRQNERDAQELWRVCQQTDEDCKYEVERVGGSDDTIKVRSSAYDAFITTRLALQGIASPIKNAFPCDGGRAHLVIRRLLDGNFAEVAIEELSTAGGSSPTQGELARFDNYAKQLYSLLWGVVVDNCLDLEHLLLPSDLLYSRVGNAPAKYLRLDTHANRASELPHEITLAWKKQRIAEHINSFINSCVSKFSDLQEAASKLDGAVTAIRKTALLFDERHSADQYASVRFSGPYPFLPVSQRPVDEPLGLGLSSENLWFRCADSCGYAIQRPLPLLASASVALARFLVRRKSDGRVSQASFYAFDNSPLDVTSRSITDAMQVLHVVRPRQDEFWCSEGGQHYRMVVEPPADGTLQDLVESGSVTEKDVKRMVRLVHGIISRIISYGPRPAGKHAHHNFDLIDARPLQFVFTQNDEDGKLNVWLASSENIVMRCGPQQPREQTQERVHELMWDQFVGGCMMLLVGSTDAEAIEAKLVSEDPLVRAVMDYTSQFSGFLEAINAHEMIESQHFAISDAVPTEKYVDCLERNGYSVIRESLARAPSGDRHAQVIADAVTKSSVGDNHRYYKAVIYGHVDDTQVKCMERSIADVYQAVDRRLVPRVGQLLRCPEADGVVVLQDATGSLLSDNLSSTSAVTLAELVHDFLAKIYSSSSPLAFRWRVNVDSFMLVSNGQGLAVSTAMILQFLPKYAAPNAEAGKDRIIRGMRDFFLDYADQVGPSNELCDQLASAFNDILEIKYGLTPMFA